MFSFILLVIFGQNLSGSAYVVLRNGYYFPWQHQPLRVLPVIHHPYHWEYSYARQQDNVELKFIKERQIINFNLLKCLIEEEKKDVCKSMLDNAKILFNVPKKPEIGTMVVNVLMTEKEYQGPPSTIAQPYPPTTEISTLQNRNVVDTSTNPTVLEIRNQDKIASPLTIPSELEDTKNNLSVMSVTQNNTVGQFPLTPSPSDNLSVKSASSDKDVNPTEQLPNTSNSLLDKNEEITTLSSNLKQ